MKPTLVKDRTYCPKGHDLRTYGYYFGTNQRCRVCNRRGGRDETANPRTESTDTNKNLLNHLVAEC
jgi:hypothetical protein